MKNRKGFTIVELVIVIAVIAILAAVLIPTFTTVTKNAKTSAAQSQAKNALDQIIALTKGSMPEGTAFYVNDDNDAQGDYLFVFEKNSLVQKDVDDNNFPKTTADNTYTVYVTYDAFDAQNATQADDLAAVRGIIAGAANLTEGAWDSAVTDQGGYYTMTYTKGEVVTTINAYYTNEIQKTIVVFIAA